MAQIPRTRDILDFQPLPSPKVPLEVGRSGFGQALSNVSQIGFKYGLQARKAEDEVALERLQQNLLDDELEIAQDLDAGAGGIPFGEFRAHADGRHQEHVAGFISEDPAIQNLLPENQVRMDKMLLASRGAISRNASKTSRLLMKSELVAREVTREEAALDNVSTNPNGVLAGLGIVTAYYKELKVRCPNNPACNPDKLALRTASGMKRANTAAYNRIIDEMVNVAAGDGTFTTHPEVSTINDLVRIIKRGDFKNLYNATQGGEAAFIRDTRIAFSSAFSARQASLEKQSRKSAYESIMGIFQDSLNPLTQHKNTPGRIAAASAKIFKSDINNPGALLNWVKGLKHDSTKPNANQEFLFEKLKFNMQRIAMKAELAGKPVSFDDIDAELRSFDPNKLHVSQLSDYLEYTRKITTPANSSIEAAIGRIKASISKAINGRAVKGGDLNAVLARKLAGGGSPDLPELVGDLPLVMSTAIENLTRNWVKANPNSRIDETEIGQIAMANILKGKHGDPTIISIDPASLEEASFIKEQGILELTAEEQFILDLHKAKQRRLAGITARAVRLNEQKQLRAGSLYRADLGFLDAFSKHIQPDMWRGLKAANRGEQRGIADRKRRLADLERERMQTAIKEKAVSPRETPVVETESQGRVGPELSGRSSFDVPSVPREPPATILEQFGITEMPFAPAESGALAPMDSLEARLGQFSPDQIAIVQEALQRFVDGGMHFVGFGDFADNIPDSVEVVDVARDIARYLYWIEEAEKAKKGQNR